MFAGAVLVLLLAFGFTDHVAAPGAAIPVIVKHVTSERRAAAPEAPQEHL